MKKKIFIIEDNRILLSYVEKSFVMAGYPVATANTGLAAVEKLSEQVADVIFMDYFLPNLNADRLCRILRRMAHLQQAHIVVMSAAASELQADFTGMGANALIAKGSFKDTAKLMLKIVEDIETAPPTAFAGTIMGPKRVHPRQMTKELLAQNRHLQAILDSIVEGILEIQDEHVVYANPAAEKLLDRSQDQLLASRWTDIFDTGDNPLISHMVAPEDHEAPRREWHHDVTIGNRALRARRLAITGEEGTTLILLVDVTEQRQARQVLQEHQRQLETLVQERTAELERTNDRLRHSQKMEAMGTIAGGVAHDLNNILSGLVSYPELLLLELPADSPLRPPLLTIKRSGESAAAIVHDLLTLARRGIGAYELVNLNDIVTDYLNGSDYTHLKSRHHLVRVEQRLAHNLLPIKGSPAHLAKVVMNLVANAAEAVSTTGQIIVSTENCYLDREKRGYEDIPIGEYVVLSVADKGIGLSAYDLQRIFEPFYIKKALGRSGTGLGLAVVWGTVQDHGGRIDISSAEGQGTLFSLYFPAIRQPLAERNEAITPEAYAGKGETVLVVDDSPEQREIAASMLQKLGYRAVAVASGEQAIDYLRENEADLVVLDMVMDPGIDGLETFKRMVAFKPRQKAIIASGFSESEQIAATRQMGAGAHIKKPYSLEKIGLAVRAELDRPSAG